MEIHNHDHAGFNGNAEESDVADPYRYAEVIAEQLLQNEAACQRIDRRENEDSRFGDGMKHHVEQHKDDKKDDRQNELQPLFGPEFELVLAGPFVSKAGRQVKFLLEQISRLCDEAAVVFGVQIDVHVAGQGTVFIADHGRSSRERDFCDIGDWNLRAGWRADQDAPQLLDVVSEVAAVPDIHWIALAALDVFRDHFAADSRSDRLLHIGNCQTVASRFRPVDFDVEIKTLRNTFCEDGTHLRNRREDLLYLRANLLDALQIRPLNLQTERRLDARQFHIETVLDGHGPGVGQPRKLEFGVHLLNELFVGHSRPPLSARLEHDRRVIHIERGVVGRAVGSPDGTKDGLDFGKRANDSILFLEQLRRLADGNSGQRCRHVERRTFVERRHELTADVKRERKRDDQKDQIEQQGGFAETQAEP